MGWLLAFCIITAVILAFNHGAHMNDDDEFMRVWEEEWEKDEY
ncbi:MAG TPA: hypothetical protein VN456_12260 [Desulfosporosinus sp.]|nr:hypothetical protein [Desulfosporosinus sp.]